MSTPGSQLSPDAPRRGGTASVRGDTKAGPARRSGRGSDNPLESLRPVSPAAVLDGGFELLRVGFARLVALTACLYVPVWLIDLILMVAYGGDAESRSPVGPAFFLLGGGSEWQWMITIAQSLALSLLGLAVGRFSIALTAGEDPSFAELARYIMRRSWVGALIAPMNALVIAVVSLCSAGFGYLFAAPLVFMSSVVAGAEGIGPLKSVRRGMSLATRSYGRAFVISFGGLCITQVIRLSFAAGPAVLVMMLDPTSGFVPVLTAVGAAVLLVTEPLTACIAARANLDMRCRLEGMDLAARMEHRFVATPSGALR